MSEDTDKESKTEPASEKRLRDAIEKGNVPFSSEPGILTSVVAILAIGLMVASPAVAHLTQRLGILLENSATYTLSQGSDATQLVLDVVWSVFLIALPVLAILSIGGIIGPLAQNVPQANLERLVPKASRLSPASNFERILGKQALFEFAKMTTKVIVISGVTYWAMMRELGRVIEASAAEVTTVPGVILSVFNSIVAPICLAALVIAIFDVVVTRLRWNRDLRMTRQEQKDEYKQSEGDPHIKERVRQIGRQRIRSRMMADLPKATILIANPTHFAVALRYVASEGGAPLVVAKGIDHLALRIRERCEQLEVPIVENKPLARSLYAATEVGDMIPADFYRAVAEVIHFVDKRNRSMAERKPQV